MSLEINGNNNIQPNFEHKNIKSGGNVQEQSFVKITGYYSSENEDFSDIDFDNPPINPDKKDVSNNSQNVKKGLPSKPEPYQTVVSTRPDGKRVITKEGNTIIGKNNNFRAMKSISEYGANPNMARRVSIMDRQRIITEVLTGTKPTSNGTVHSDSLELNVNVGSLNSKEKVEQFIQQNQDQLSDEQMDALANNLCW